MVGVDHLAGAILIDAVDQHRMAAARLPAQLAGGGSQHTVAARWRQHLAAVCDHQLARSNPLQLFPAHTAS